MTGGLPGGRALRPAAAFAGPDELARAVGPEAVVLDLPDHDLHVMRDSDCAGHRER
jgi:hypothetical protein